MDAPRLPDKIIEPVPLKDVSLLLGSVCKLGLCHSERSEESRFSGAFDAKSEILRRSAPQNDMQEDFAYTP